MNFIAMSLAAGLFLMSCSKNPGSQDNPDPADTVIDPIPYASLPQTQVSFNLAGTAEYVNVMGNTRPNLPAFRVLTKKTGILRGYVKNTFGKPLAGAYIGIRSSAVGGTYTMATGITDNKGYYEIEPPFGAVHLFAAGYALDYAGGIAAQGLYPADGSAESFSSNQGGVENFVLLPYGLGDPAALTEKPWYPRNYFGGSIRISYTIYEDMWSQPGSLPANAEMEITLTPDELLLDATERKTFIIRKKVGNMNFNINNIPVGRYKITAKLVNGTALKLKATDFWQHAVYGMKPTEALETSKVLFLPHGSEARSGQPNLGGWNNVNIKVEVP